ncbi:MAG: peroxiredoxin [Eubacteriales bacterium]|nr:peroxiredoxin [Eubacteriales bacterium]
MLEIGTMAPDFTLQDQDGKNVSLSDFKGKKVVLYFYSKDNTAGCNKQACAYAENYPAFVQKDAVVIGVSKDTSASHRKFADKFNLPFILLADPETQVLQKYDVWAMKNMYGKQVMGTVRSSYLIDEEGKIVKAHAKVKPEQNALQMLADLDEPAE